jgi:hypothetical protein
MAATMKKTLFSSITRLALLLVAGCATDSYKISKNESSAKIKTSKHITMCKKNNYYSLSPTSDNQAYEIPANERISIGSITNYTDYSGLNLSCFPLLSFIPKEGEMYIMDTYISGNKCYIELVREDKTKETGVVVEASIGADNCKQM